jgi:hypothetical protein
VNPTRHLNRGFLPLLLVVYSAPRLSITMKLAGLLNCANPSVRNIGSGFLIRGPLARKAEKNEVLSCEAVGRRSKGNLRVSCEE